MYRKDILSQAKPSQALGALRPFLGVRSLKSVLHSRYLHRTKTVSFCGDSGFLRFCMAGGQEDGVP